jgi:ribosomal protein S18 acetylase RimI-like enzyme
MVHTGFGGRLHGKGPYHHKGEIWDLAVQPTLRSPTQAVATQAVATVARRPKIGDLKLFELISICPLVTLRDREER